MYKRQYIYIYIYGVEMRQLWTIQNVSEIIVALHVKLSIKLITSVVAGELTSTLTLDIAAVAYTRSYRV